MNISIFLPTVPTFPTIKTKEVLPTVPFPTIARRSRFSCRRCQRFLRWLEGLSFLAYCASISYDSSKVSVFLPTGYCAYGANVSYDSSKVASAAVYLPTVPTFPTIARSYMLHVGRALHTTRTDKSSRTRDTLRRFTSKTQIMYVHGHRVRYVQRLPRR